MLRLWAFLLLCALPYIDGTPVSCEKRFHKLYTSIDRKKSDCTVIRVLTGYHYSLPHCQELACREGGNVINFKETKDDFDDNVCEILNCRNGNLRLSDSAEGFNVLLNDAEDELKCSAANKRLLSCWTCTDVADEDACRASGNYEPCLQDDAICGQYVETDTRGRTWKVSRGCIPASECADSMWGNIGECRRVEYGHVDDLVSGCQHCGYGFYGKHHRCYPVHPNLRRARLYESQQDWTMISHANDGKEVECPLVAQEEDGYTIEACERLAIAIGGNVMSHRHSRHCRVHKCEKTGAGISDLKLRDYDHGWNIYVLAHEFPCTSLEDRQLACKTCDANSEEECSEKDYMQDCGKSQDVCFHKRTLNKNGEVTHVQRGCSMRSQCTEAMWNPDSFASCSFSKDGSQTCNTCLFGTAGKDHGCHAPFDQKCIDNFKRVKEDDSHQAMTPSCIQVVNQKEHWLQSCLNLACLTNANVVHYGGTNCEVYICKLRKNEKYIFRNRRNRHLRIYVAK